MLVIRTSDGEIAWMNVSDYLKKHTEGRTEPVRQIEFQGEPFNAQNLLRMRDKLLPRPELDVS